MIATVTLNPALDRILFLRRLRLGRRIVAEEVQTTTGGKGTVVSSLLRQLDMETRAFGFVAGPAGHIQCALLDRIGVPYEFVEAEGDTRINTVLVDTEAGDQTTVIAETLRVRDDHIQKIETLIRASALQSRIWVLSGSLPPGAPPELWAGLIEILRESGATVLFDSSGEGLRQGLKARPFLIKPNLPELEECVGRSLPSREHIRDAAGSLLQEGPDWVVVSLGSEGLMMVSRNDAFFARPLAVEVASTSGAGDGVMTGLAMGLERGADIETCLRLGAAIATSVVMQQGTAQCRPADVERFFREIHPERLE